MSRIYWFVSIKELIKSGQLKRTFTTNDIKKIYPNFPPEYLSRHCDNNPGGHVEYFDRVKHALYKMREGI